MIPQVRQIQLELLPHERAVLLKGNFTMDKVLAQLEARIEFGVVAGELDPEREYRGCVDDGRRLDYHASSFKAAHG